MDDFDFELSFDLDLSAPAEPPKKKKDKDPIEQPKVKATRSRGVTTHHFRRAVSELNLEQQLPWHFHNGDVYHVISGGDVDSLTYLRSIVKQQHIKYLLVSTWCMALTDAEELHMWLQNGYVDRIDFYVGEIFRGSYGTILQYLENNCVVDGARICVFRNHSKVMCGYGDRFDFCIESSANINTNPRTEQTVISIDSDVVDFYRSFYDGIHSFENRYNSTFTPYRKDGN